MGVAHVLPDLQRHRQSCARTGWRSRRSRSGICQNPARCESPHRNQAVGTGKQRAFMRQERGRGAGHVLLVGAEHGPVGVVGRPPGQRRRQHDAVVRNVIGLRAAVAEHADEAIQPLAVLGQLAGAVHLHLLAVEAAILHADLVEGFRLRTLRDQVQEAGRRGVAIENRGGPRSTSMRSSVKGSGRHSLNVKVFTTRVPSR